MSEPLQWLAVGALVAGAAAFAASRAWRAIRGRASAPPSSCRDPEGGPSGREDPSGRCGGCPGCG